MVTRTQDPKPAEIRLTAFECPACGRRLEALPSAQVRCKCGRPMERRRPARGAPDAPGGAPKKRGRVPRCIHYNAAIRRDRVTDRTEPNRG